MVDGPWRIDRYWADTGEPKIERRPWRCPRYRWWRPNHDDMYETLEHLKDGDKRWGYDSVIPPGGD
jgi:hypothetical protein